MFDNTAANMDQQLDAQRISTHEADGADNASEGSDLHHDDGDVGESPSPYSASLCIMATNHDPSTCIMMINHHRQAPAPLSLSGGGVVHRNKRQPPMYETPKQGSFFVSISGYFPN